MSGGGPPWRRLGPARSSASSRRLCPPTARGSGLSPPGRGPAGTTSSSTTSGSRCAARRRSRAFSEGSRARGTARSHGRRPARSADGFRSSGRRKSAGRSSRAGPGRRTLRLSALVFPGDLPAVRVERGRRRGGRAGPRSLEAPARPRPGTAPSRRAQPPRRPSSGELAAGSSGSSAELAGLLPPDRKTLHAARIAAKRVRYALEVRRAARAAFPSGPPPPALLPGRRGRRPRPRRARGTRRIRRGYGHRGRPRIRAAGARPRGRRHEGAPGRPGGGCGSRQAGREAARVPRVPRDEVG